jgi:hypothetical protein
MAVEIYPVDPTQYSRLQTLSELGQALPLLGHHSKCHLTGLPEAHDARDIVRSRPVPLLLAATVQQGGELNRRLGHPNEEGPDPFGTVQLVRREGKEIYMQLVHSERNLPESLGRIGMEQHPPILTDLPDFGERLNRADFVMRSDHADENGPVGDRLRYLDRIDHSGPIHWKIGDVKALLRETATGIEHGAMLNGRGDNMVSPVLGSPGHPFERQIIGLACPRGENDLDRLTPNEVAELLPCLLDSRLGGPANDMGPR